MDNKVKKWFASLFALSFLVLSLTVGFSDFVHTDTKGDVTSSEKEPNTEPKTACCFIGKDTNKLFFSIEDALDIAGSNSTSDIVYVIPGTNPRITRDCTIAKEDTLMLIYDIKASSSTFKDNEQEGYCTRSTSGDFADSSASMVASNLKSNVTIAEGITLTNLGNLKIGGQTGTYGNKISGNTSGLYCQISLENDAKIINGTNEVDSSPVIECYGYIKETEKNNGSQIVCNKGKIQEPMVIYDFKGGNYSLTCYFKEVFPFAIYDFPNITATLDIYKDCQIALFMCFYCSNKYHAFNDCVVLSNGDSSLFKFTNRCKFKYTSPFWDKGVSLTQLNTSID